MIGLDTNVLVRYLAEDDATQSAAATRLIEQELTSAEPGFISSVVLTELGWVLKRLYRASEGELLETVADLLDSPQFQLENRAVVQAAVRRMQALKAKAGWTDLLIAQIAQAQGCRHTVSFDKTAVRLAGMQLLV